MFGQMKKVLLGLLLITLSSASLAGNAWVYGYVEEIKDYGALYANSFQAAIYLKDVGVGAPECKQTYQTRVDFHRFRLVEEVNGLTAASQQRMFSMILAAYMAGKKVGLYYDTTSGPDCKVVAVTIGDESVVKY